MPIAEYAAGTETVTTTEWSITTDTAGPDAQTDDGVYQALLDLSALAAGDVFEFRAYEKVQAAGTQRGVFTASFAGAQHDPVWVSPTLVLLHGWDMTIKKISGTDRAIEFSVRRVS